MVLLPLLILTGLPARPAAPFSCDDALEVVDEHLGELNERPLRARVCTSPLADDRHQVLVRVHWEAPLDDEPVWQTLLSGEAAAPAGGYAIMLDGAALSLSYASGSATDPAGQLTRETWRWDPQQRQFVDHQSTTSSAWADGRAAVEKALAEGDLAAARAAMAGMGATPNGGHDWYDDPFFREILIATEASARRIYRLGRAEEAAALVADVLQNPPVTSPASTPRPGELVFCRDLQPTCAGAGAFNDLPLDMDTANLAVALAHYLGRGGQDQAAASLLQQVLVPFPTSADVHLALADALWDLDRHDEARAHYRRFVELRPNEKLSRKQRRRLGG